MQDLLQAASIRCLINHLYLQFWYQDLACAVALGEGLHRMGPSSFNTSVVCNNACIRGFSSISLASDCALLHLCRLMLDM